MESKLNQHRLELQEFDKQRKQWLMLSAFVVFAVLGIIFDWTQIHNSEIEWLIVLSGLTICVVWWYWSMRLIRSILHHRMIETQILKELIGDVRHVIKTLTQKD